MNYLVFELILWCTFVEKVNFFLNDVKLKFIVSFTW